MDTQSAIEELQQMKRELRRLKFQVTGRARGVVATMERMVDKLLKRLKPLKPL
jgi:hypothetical protein